MNAKILLLALWLGSLCWACNSIQKSTENNDSVTYNRAEKIKTPEDALQLLIEGNKRFVANAVLNDDLSNAKRKLLKDKGQNPFAVIVTCSDSRVPPELLFDQGLGDLFVIRVAGNVIDSVGMGSIQYAAEHLETPLIVVLGHEKCGAVHATIAGGEFPGSIPSITARILPSINNVKLAYGDVENLEEMVIDANAQASVNTLNTDAMLKHLIELGKLNVIGATYYLENGLVVWHERSQNSEKHR